MAYSDLTSWMFNLERFGIKLGLDNITEFMSRIGDPQNEFRSIHVTGTNGKGSVCAFIAEILRESGLKVGLYTSPHLVDFRERIRIDRKEISQKDVVRVGTELKSYMEAMAAEDSEKQLTFFEFTTGLAFRYFSEKKVDVVVAEVGMGGRLDATNVLEPEVAVITRIGLEHTSYLGNTIPEIAREKAGIIKEGGSAVTCERNAEALDVITHACDKRKVPLRRIDRDFGASHISQSLNGTEFDYAGTHELRGVKTRLLGRYQAENAAAAIAVAEELSRRGTMITDENIQEGILRTRWPGRLDIVSRRPLVIFDGSHNPDGVATTVSVLKELGVIPLTYVLGCMDDKDVRGIVHAIGSSAAKIICTQVKYKRALPAERLATIVREEFRGDVETQVSSEDAIRKAMEDKLGKGVCIIGSLYLVGEAMQRWQDRS